MGPPTQKTLPQYGGARAEKPKCRLPPFRGSPHNHTERGSVAEPPTQAIDRALRSGEENMSFDKASLRKELYARRVACSANGEILTGLQRRVADVLAATERSCIGFYRPIRGEPDITDVLAAWAAASPGRSLCVPVVDDARNGLMHFALWTPSARMHAGVWNIEVPEEDVPVEPDMIFAPCVGVNRRGMRLGNGGGFFDRYLSRRRAAGEDVETVAVAYDELVTEAFEAQPYDEPFAWIITQSRLLGTGFSLECDRG